MKSLQVFLVVLLFWIPAALRAQPRQIIPLVDWAFNASADKTPPADTQPWAMVRVPHVFRQSGVPDKAAGWYRTRIQAPAQGQSCALRIEGAATVVEVQVNGVLVGSHRGAYTAAEFDLTAALKAGVENELLLRVSNLEEESQDCLSRSNLFHTPGGLYRPVSLITTGQIRFAPDLGSSGVYLTPTDVTEKHAQLKVEALVHNGATRPAILEVRHRVLDDRGETVAEFKAGGSIPDGGTIRLPSSGEITNPRLWSLRAARLYTVESSLYADGKLSDRIVQRTGFRRIEIRDGQFYLNGSQVLLRGVNKHHMNEWEWNALSNTELLEEWDGMDAMGVNTVRLAHYPHSSFEYDQADERGLAVWAENGLAGQSWKKLAHEENTVTPDGERITREMVRQNWNHPSILIWSSGNETIVDVAAHYADVIRSEDKSRLVTFAANADKPRGCDFDSYNTYDGWYGGHYTGYQQLPYNAYVSETGAGSWASHHLPYGTTQWTVDQFESEEYQELFTEYRLQTACVNDAQSRPLLLWWNYREFYDTKFKQNRNTKGIVTLDGAKKDIWYLFQAFLNKNKPVLHLAGSNHFLRHFAADNGIKAFGNADSAELFINGKSAGLRRNGDYRQPDSSFDDAKTGHRDIPGIKISNVFFWKAELNPGRNVVEIRDARGLRDSMVIYQTAPTGSVPSAPDSLVQDLRSSNPANAAFYIDRPIKAQSPFYYSVDGSSDNTFDRLPAMLEGASWIATDRTSKAKTDLSFTTTKPVHVYVLQTTGEFPIVTLKAPDANVAAASRALALRLSAAGFKKQPEPMVWRDHMLTLANAAIWTKDLQSGEHVQIPGEAVDSLVLVKEFTQ